MERIRVPLEAADKTLEVLWNLSFPALSTINTTDHFSIVVGDSQVLRRAATGNALSDHIN